jgi:hypothetical protein
MKWIGIIWILFIIPYTGWSSSALIVENTDAVVRVDNFEFCIDSNDNYSIGNIERQRFTDLDKGS